MTRSKFVGLLMALVLAAVGCSEKGSGDAPPTPPAPVGAKVVMVVFLEQESACECTLARQKVTWANLQAALEGLEPRPTVDVIHFDVEPDIAQPYQDLKAVMVSPALYFLDEDGALIATEQGEVTTVAIAAHLGTK